MKGLILIRLYHHETTSTFDLKIKLSGVLTCRLVRPFFLASTFGLLYLAHGCITMRQCVILHSCSRYNVHHWHWGHINSAFDMTLCPTCKLCLLSRCHSIIVYMGLSHLVHSKYDYRNTTLSFDLEVKFIELLTCNFCLLWHLLTIIGTLVYHHEGKCRVHSWRQYDDDLWP